MSFQLLTFEPVFQIVFSSAAVRQSTHVFCLVDDDREAVVRDRERDPLDGGVTAEDRLGVLHRPGRVREVDLVAAEALEAAAGAGDADGDAGPRFFFWKPSAAAIVYGPTVLEPSAVTVPLSARHAGRAARRCTAVASDDQRDGSSSCVSPVFVSTLRGECRRDARGGLKEGEDPVAMW